MKKRWFVVILTIGLLLCVMPLSALALSSDPITDSDGNIICWEDLSTDLYSFDVSDVSDVSQEQTPVAVDPGTNAASGPAETDPVETDPVKDAADANSAKTAAAATTPFVEDLYADDPIPDLYADTPGSADGTGSDQAVCAINGKTYATLTDAINDAADGAQIDLLQDIELTEGLSFYNKKLTISGGSLNRTLTLKGIGIYASGSNITFENLTLHIYAHIHPNQNGGAANLITSTNLCLDDVDFELISDTPTDGGAGLYMERGSNLYLDNGTHAVIRDFNGYKASGIYAEETDYDPNEGKIEINSSYLEVTGCYHAGLLIDPLDLTLTSSEVVLEKNGCHGYGFGLACYDGKVTLLSSTIKATENNTGGYYGFGVFAGELEVDGGSTLIASDNGVGGLGVGAESVIHGGAQVYCERNGESDAGCAGGLVVHAEHYDDSTYEGELTIESGAYVYARNNVGLSGLLNE